jgi:hypothetical protein
MPMGILSPEFASYCRWRVVAVLLFVVLQWMMPEAGSDAASTSLQIKLEVPPELEDLEGSVVVLAILVTGSAISDGCLLDPPGSGACGEDWSAASRSGTRRSAYGDEAPGSSSSTAFWPLTLRAERRPLPPWLLPLVGQPKVMINLHPWMPFCFPMFGSRYGDPSGVVPGVTVVVHGWKHRERVGDGAGPDRFFIYRSEALRAKLQDLFVVSNLSRVLYKYCNSTALF